MESIKEAPIRPVRPAKEGGKKEEARGKVGGEEVGKREGAKGKGLEEVVKKEEGRGKERKPESSQSKARSKSSYSKQSYRKVARPVMPFASDPTKFYENIRKEKFNRKKTDITQYANAHFQGGVFVNGFPGQSI